MRYITPSIFLALATLGCVLFFLFHCFRSIQNGPVSLRPLKAEHRRLSFAGACHPMEKQDRLPVLAITLIYALTAFFQLGDFRAVQNFYDFGDRQAITIRISGDPVYTTGIRYYPGLGTGARVSGEDGRAYNIEISSDGQTWSTLWLRQEEGSADSYYWAKAQDYPPSYALTQKYNQLFKWLDVTVTNPQRVQYLRITGNPSANSAGQQVLELGRLCLLGKDGQPTPFNWTMADGSPIPEGLEQLFLVDTLVPEKSTWHNSTYFDEIYHARTAKEHIDGVYPYEVTHPPLGKLILGIGIRLFGMTPFGWRFMGALFGVLMLPILYIFLKNLFGKTVVASCGAILFAADFMHLTQTRIATIDTYGVFFILCMYFFMYRYLTLPAGAPFRKGALPLFLSGLMWGLGAASKWTVFYAGVGLAILYFMGFYQKLRDWPRDATSQALRPTWIVQTLLFSVLCFVLLPFVIYTLSYLPYAQALGVDLSLKNSLSGLAEGFPPLIQNVRDHLSGAADTEGYRAAVIPQGSLTGIMLNNQWYMFHYHQGVSQAHPYSSTWFQWIVNARPILYYMDNTYVQNVMTHTTRFAAFSNPAVCWTGLVAILVCAAHSFRRLWAKAAFLALLGLSGAFFALRVSKILDPVLGEEILSLPIFGASFQFSQLQLNRVILVLSLLFYLALCAFVLWASPGYSGKAAFLLVGYLAQLAPWMLIGRTTFEYHYFPSILFLVLAISYLFNCLMEAGQDWKLPIFGLTGLSVGLYALFYPVLIGLTIPSWYQPLVKWIESWPF